MVQHIISTPQMKLQPLRSGKIRYAEDDISERPEHNAVAIAQNALTTFKNADIKSTRHILAARHTVLACGGCQK